MPGNVVSGADDAVSIASLAIDRLDVAPEVKHALLAIQAELTSAYQRSFVEMLEAIRKQASALERLQNTLGLLVEQIAPQLKDRIPVAVRPAEPGETPDIPSALVSVDPIGMGFTLTQANLAHALALSTPDVSVLVRALGLNDDGECAVVLRRGKTANHTVVNYHPKAIDRFVELVETATPSMLKAEQQSALRRVRRALSQRPKR